ncbi:hypothetical protein ACHHV8_25470 [Paenibacillus sp. TAB 01]|uniref:hypothetical protein n=1 Tax=Paenibacillus sp. TAB 01 TaxID=3368988 RepID=UPI0037504F59
MSVKDKTDEPIAPTYSKQQFLESKIFTVQQKDVLSALLKADESYTIDQVTGIVENFARKVVQ